ncbi:MAG: adenosylmethionine decarboxylase [Candidatus Xenobium sp.]|jgi:S-adenosylmethionine decarboxylase|nr:S-adenosylmethionine decarboxylase proenzyme [Burkholderiales bacterium]
MIALGTHIIAELSQCRQDRLADLDLVRDAMVQAAQEAGAEVREVAFHRFSPQGVSGVVVIAESHLSIHTWPELGYAAIDVYTCGLHTNPERACHYLAEFLESRQMTLTTLERGLPRPGGAFGHVLRSEQESPSLSGLVAVGS